jgi:flagellar protein FliS
MLACNDPYDAYQRVEFDAWVRGASPQELVQICFDQLIIALTTATLANERGDARLKSRAMTRAVTALIALEMGIDRRHEMADVLSEFYGAARKSILASSVNFDREVLSNICDDFSELREAFRR